ncbi:hypothetical protein RND71_039727 [Anisodus tanguticus]|uniref:Uncharacterized protein n=1 Tax=Anisodus tanguticus TaxID=243964 RepID=A0AAE1QXD3_9SOLA|nr:hypothetical protein RND71_039727 [Anisodus tanguticus]
MHDDDDFYSGGDADDSDDADVDYDFIDNDSDALAHHRSQYTVSLSYPEEICPWSFKEYTAKISLKVLTTHASKAAPF